MFKKLIKKQIEKRGLILNQLTPKEQIISFINTLRPYRIDKDLIRIGPNKDGGYIVPDDLEDIEACISPGVHKISEFEHTCLRYGMQIHLADKSIEKPDLNVSEDKYTFLKKHIGCINNADYTTIDNWVDSLHLNSKKDLLLQMDIEGAEYLSFINMSDSLLKRFRILIVEFHYLHDLWNKQLFSIGKVVFEKILQTHTCVHIHPNNAAGINTRFGIEIPVLAEFTFLRNDRANVLGPQTTFPHPLDFDNTSKAHIVLPKNWYGCK